MDCRHKAGVTYRQDYHFVLRIFRRFELIFKGNVLQNVNVLISTKRSNFLISCLICLSSNAFFFKMNEKKVFVH